MEKSARIARVFDVWAMCSKESGGVEHLGRSQQAPRQRLGAIYGWPEP